jgi:hypothetical protein
MKDMMTVIFVKYVGKNMVGKINQKTWIKIKPSLALIKDHSRHINCLRLHKATTKQHMDKIYEICVWLRMNNYNFITEAEFIGGGRADIFVLETAEAYEVLHSETLKSFNKKKYPVPTYPIKTTDEWRGL